MRFKGHAYQGARLDYYPRATTDPGEFSLGVYTLKQHLEVPILLSEIGDLQGTLSLLRSCFWQLRAHKILRTLQGTRSTLGSIGLSLNSVPIFAFCPALFQ